MNTSIAFFGINGSFNFHKIGGIDAYVRRLTLELSGMDYSVFLINYGSNEDLVESVSKNITIIKYININPALQFLLDQNIQKVVVSYLYRQDRRSIQQFKNNNNGIDFSLMLSVYHDSFFKRNAAYLEAAYNVGYKNLYCFSDRIRNSVSKFTSKASLLLPPVDDNFFLEKKRRRNKKNKKFRISYMGRLDKGKGADIVIEFFKNNNLDKDLFEFYIYSYPWKNDVESMSMHTYLIEQDTINYVESKVKVYSTAVDNQLKQIIDDTDLFLLPYRTLSSTIDSPLVPLEILSRSKIFITTNQGIMNELVSDKQLLLKDSTIQEIEAKINYAYSNYELLLNLSNQLLQKLDYRTSSVVKQLLATI